MFTFSKKKNGNEEKSVVYGNESSCDKDYRKKLMVLNMIENEERKRELAGKEYIFDQPDVLEHVFSFIIEVITSKDTNEQLINKLTLPLQSRFIERCYNDVEKDADTLITNLRGFFGNDEYKYLLKREENGELLIEKKYRDNQEFRGLFNEFIEEEILFAWFQLEWRELIDIEFAQKTLEKIKNEIINSNEITDSNEITNSNEITDSNEITNSNEITVNNGNNDTTVETDKNNFGNENKNFATSQGNFSGGEKKKGSVKQVLKKPKNRNKSIKIKKPKRQLLSYKRKKSSLLKGKKLSSSRSKKSSIRQ